MHAGADRERHPPCLRSLLTHERILDVIELTADALQRIRGRAPCLVGCGLNPHAGEHRLFGDREEERIIIPGSKPAPDTAFLPWKRRSTGDFICMDHDQDPIPVKALAFGSAVNTTLGLPIIRTTVDHGTALDIAWQDPMRSDRKFAAVRLAKA